MLLRASPDKIRFMGHSSRPLGGAEGQQWKRAGGGRRGGGASGPGDAETRTIRFPSRLPVPT